MFEGRMTNCSNCNTDFEGSFCNHCGQKNYTEKDKSITYLFKETFTLITNLEGTFFTTLKAIFLKPGQLSADFSDGRRKKYFKPASMYLLVVVIYLFFPLFKGLNMDLHSYKTQPFTGKLITKQIENSKAILNVSEETLALKFKEISQNTSKVLLLIFIPFSALFIFLLYFRKKRLWFDNLILATEINIFYLLFFFIIIPIFYYLLLRITGLNDLNDELMGFLFTILFGFYVSFVFNKTFQNKWGKALAKGMTFSFLHTLFKVIIYKFIVFEITISLL